MKTKVAKLVAGFIFLWFLLFLVYDNRPLDVEAAFEMLYVGMPESDA